MRKSTTSTIKGIMGASIRMSAADAATASNVRTKKMEYDNTVGSMLNGDKTNSPNGVISTGTTRPVSPFVKPTSRIFPSSHDRSGSIVYGSRCEMMS